MNVVREIYTNPGEYVYITPEGRRLPIPEELVQVKGVYFLQATRVDQKYSPASGNTYWTVEWRIHTLGPQYGKRVWSHWFDTPKASFQWARVVDHPSHAHPGMCVKAQVSLDAYQDRIRNRVWEVYPVQMRTQRPRLRRIRRLTHVTHSLLPVTGRAAKAVIQAYRDAWNG